MCIRDSVFQNYCHGVVWSYQALSYKLAILFFNCCLQWRIWILNICDPEDLDPNLFVVVLSLHHFVLAVSIAHGLLYQELGFGSDAISHLVH